MTDVKCAEFSEDPPTGCGLAAPRFPWLPVCDELSCLWKYFRLPFAPGGRPDRTKVILPAAKFWVLKNLLPTGEIRLVDDRLDFRKGKSIAG